jgi:hypothetical protein
LENGVDQLKNWFPEIQLVRYPDSLLVTDPEPLVEFVLSTSRFGLKDDQREEFSNLINDEIRSSGGAIQISKDSGIFISKVG